MIYSMAVVYLVPQTRKHHRKLVKCALSRTYAVSSRLSRRYKHVRRFGSTHLIATQHRHLFRPDISVSDFISFPIDPLNAENISSQSQHMMTVCDAMNAHVHRYYRIDDAHEFLDSRWKCYAEKCTVMIFNFRNANASSDSFAVVCQKQQHVWLLC